MNIERAIRTVFEKEIGQLETAVPPYRGDLRACANRGKGRKERYGSLVLCMGMVLVTAIFSLKTGMLRSPLVMEWENITALIPERFMALFFEFITEIFFSG